MELIASNVHQKTGNHLRSLLIAIMALDHRRLIKPGKKVRPNFFTFDKFTLQNLANKSVCVQTRLVYHLYITSEVKQYHEAPFSSYRPRTECSVSQFCNTNCTHSIFRTIDARVGFSETVKKISKITYTASRFSLLTSRLFKLRLI